MTDHEVAVVTGAARGIGLAVAERLAKDGLHVLIADVREDLAQASAETLHSNGLAASAVQVDISDPASVAEACSRITSELAAPSVLVNNAGVVSNEQWDTLSLAEWNKVLAINLTGTMLMTQALLPGMCAAGYGRVVNVVSLAGRNGGVSVGPAYAASKAGVIGLTRHLAGKAAQYGVTVNAVAPGTTRTDMAASFTPEQMLAINATIPLGRLGEVPEIAAAVAYFASPEAGFTTGAVLDVNGGMYFG